MRMSKLKINLSCECEEFDGRLPWDRITFQLKSEGGNIRLLYVGPWALFVDSNVKTKIVQQFFFQNPKPLRERDGFFSKLIANVFRDIHFIKNLSRGGGGGHCHIWAI